MTRASALHSSQVLLPFDVSLLGATVRARVTFTSKFHVRADVLGILHKPPPGPAVALARAAASAAAASHPIGISTQPTAADAVATPAVGEIVPATMPAPQAGRAGGMPISAEPACTCSGVDRKGDKGDSCCLQAPARAEKGVAVGGAETAGCACSRSDHSAGIEDGVADGQDPRRQQVRIGGEACEEPIPKMHLASLPPSSVMARVALGAACFAMAGAVTLRVMHRCAATTRA